MSGKSDLQYYQGVLEVFWSFFLLGLTSFGGPAAHLGYFNQTFIKGKKWATEAQYAQWVALSQVVPGPGSSQVGFALGYHRAGWLGAWAAFIGFTLPSFVIMVLLSQFGHLWQDQLWFVKVVHGLKLLAVVVVADACLSMWRAFCKSTAMSVLALLSSAFLVFLPMIFPELGMASLWVLFAASVFSLFISPPVAYTAEPLPAVRFAPWLLAMVIGLFFVGFVLTDQLSQLFSNFYQAGALVFGGGHVVLPMLSAFVSDSVADAELLIGYAAAQAVPGPMFTMASFLGASSAPSDANVWLWAGVATFAVFLSGLLLMLSAQSVWQGLSRYARFRSALMCLNAAVVGILLAALWNPIVTSSVLGILDIVVVLLGFAWLRVKRPSIFTLILSFVALGLIFGR